MDALVNRLAQILIVVGAIGLLIGLIMKIPGVGDWMAGPGGWFRFAMACGIIAIAGKLGWPTKDGS